MPLAAIIFDLDGTLVDTNATHVEAWRQGLEAKGLTAGADRIADEIGKGGDQVVAALFGQDIEASKGDAIRDAVSEAFRTLAESREFRLFPDVLPLLHELRARGLKLALATSSEQDTLDLIMSRVPQGAGSELRACFDALVTASDVEQTKPAPNAAVLAAERLAVSPAECAMIGDTPYDATSARHAGIVSLGVSNALRTTASAKRSSPQHEKRQHDQHDDLMHDVAVTRLMQAGARRVWRSMEALFGELEVAMQVASPLAMSLTHDAQERLMREALDVARDGMAHGEAPIGCVIADRHGRVVSRGYNEFNRTGNSTAHAEIVAFARVPREVAQSHADDRALLLVSTLEPCVMCTGAAMVGGVDSILFGLRAPADNGSQRVTPPESPGSGMPRIVGDILAAESRALFEQWLATDPPEAQAAYGRQLLSFADAT